MATTMTLAQLRTAVRQRADMVNSQFVTDAELNSYINQSYFELYDLLVQKYGDDYYIAAPYVFTTVGGVDLYNLPTDFYKMRGVDASVQNGSPDSWITLKPFNFAERNKFRAPFFNGVLPTLRPTYRILGNQLYMSPVPQANTQIRLWYIPKMNTLDNDTDTLEGISGWTEYVIIDAAIKCLQKEESDVSVLALQKQAIIDRIENAAENRDAGSPATVSDQRRINGWYGSNGFGGWGGDDGLW